MAREQTLSELLHQLETRALHQATALDVLLDSHASADQSWSDLREAAWLKQFWQGAELNKSHDLYAAVVDQSGNIVLHTEPQRVAQRLERGWYERRLSVSGGDIVWAHKSPLAGDRSAYDISLPLLVGNKQFGEYHQALDARWAEREIAANQQAALQRWLAFSALATVVNAAAVGGLVFLARRYRALSNALGTYSRKHTRSLVQLGNGLAHEIRNPLHALRINLHTLRRSQSGRSSLPPDQIAATIEESNAAIDRLDELMRDLLRFADPTPGQIAEVDAIQEVQSTLSLLGEDLRRENIEVRTQFEAEEAPVSMDPVRLRQALLNILTFAQHRAGKSGTIDVQVGRHNGGVDISVADNGPPLPEELRKRLFEPFQAPAETGSGLGLALVQVYFEEAGGRAAWDGDFAAKNRCHLWLPLVQNRSKGVSS